jgi:predicted ArsR family transcriptional regulator
MTEWTKEKVVELLAKNDKAVGRALLRLHQNQTDDEQVTQTVKYRNMKGFRPCHARMGSSMAEFFLNKGYLSPKQAAYWRVCDKNGNMRIGIYANQLLKEIES